MISIKYKNFRFNHLDVLILLSIMYKKNLCSVSDIRKVVDIAPNNLTRHLKDLSELKILNIENNGIGKPKKITVNVGDPRVFSLVNGLIDFFLAPPLSPEDMKKLKQQRDAFIKLVEEKENPK